MSSINLHHFCTLYGFLRSYSNPHLVLLLHASMYVRTLNTDMRTKIRNLVRFEQQKKREFPRKTDMGGESVRSRGNAQ